MHAAVSIKHFTACSKRIFKLFNIMLVLSLLYGCVYCSLETLHGSTIGDSPTLYS
jgi:hypothetical protein